MDDGAEQAMIVTFRCAGGLASPAGRAAVAALEDALIETLGDAAEVDGHGFGEGVIEVFVYGRDARAMFATARPLLARAGLGDGTALLRFGPPEDGVASVEVAV